MVLLDIRTPKEHARRHLEGAVLVPTPPPPLTSAQFAGLRARLAHLGIMRDVPIGVYCKKGIRSRIAVGLLREMGYTNVTDLGGIETMTH